MSNYVTTVYQSTLSVKDIARRSVGLATTFSGSYYSHPSSQYTNNDVQVKTCSWCGSDNWIDYSRLSPIAKINCAACGGPL